MAEEKAEFRNTSKGVIGASVFAGNGERGGVAVKPGETVWLSEAEQVMTANAPVDPKNNPFVAGTGENGRPALEVVTEPRQIGTHTRPIGEKAEDVEATKKAKAAERKARRSKRQSEETGAAEQPAGDAPEGQYGVGEEVGTPEAAAK